ncbi:MAG: preprotein translocase subunit SecY [Acutalibacteraceae bacterium]
MHIIETIKNAWKIADIRKKILFTLLVIAVFRVGAVIPVPYIDIAALKAGMQSASTDGTLFDYLSILTGGALEYGAIFAMSVTPYINSSIIMQLLTVAIPALERLAKEGEEGRKKIAKYTRFVTVILGLIQGVAYFFYLKNSGYVAYDATWEIWFKGAVIVSCLTAGSAIMMWLGEKIDENGIGNGISILLFAGIISRGPQAAATLWQYFKLGSSQGKYYFIVPGIIILFLVMIWFIVFMTAAERRIPIQYAKRVVGRKMYGGNSTFMPIQVNMSGVMPIIFASSILSIPTTITAFMTNTSSKWYQFFSMFNYNTVMYGILYFALIIAFAYFYGIW